MLIFKPRLRSATQVSAWKPVPESKNRGSVSQINNILTKDYQLNGYASEEGNANGIRLSRDGIRATAASVLWRNSFNYPIDITVENYIAGGADGIITAIMNDQTPLTTLGGGGGNIGFPGPTSNPTVTGISQDQYSNSGQPTPFYGFVDSRISSGGQYPTYYASTSVADGWHTVRTLWESNNTVTVWKDGVQILQASWLVKTGYNLPVGPLIIGIFAATGSSTQDAFVRKLVVNSSTLYVAPGYS